MAPLTLVEHPSES